MFWRRKKEEPKTSHKSKPIEASEIEADQFFKTLISSFVDTYSIDSRQGALDAYRSCPQLKTIVNRSANAFINSKKGLYQKDPKGENSSLVTSGELYELLKKPHFLQNQNEFWRVMYVNWSLYGITYARKGLKLTKGNYPRYLLSLPAVDVWTFYKENSDYFQAKTIKDIVKKYQISDGKDQNNYYDVNDPSEIWTIQNASLEIKNFGLLSPENPLKADERTIGTLKIIADIKNNLLGNHGAMGIINPDGKEADGDTASLRPDEKIELQKAYSNYGLKMGQDKLIITNKAIKFTAISSKMSELLLTEYEREATKSLANSHSFPVGLLSSDEKYQNKDISNKELYINKIIPESSIFSSSLNDEFGLEKINQEFKFDYSHLPFLQEDKELQSKINKTNTEIITKLNESVSRDEMSPDQAINTLVLIGIPESEAPKYIKPL